MTEDAVARGPVRGTDVFDLVLGGFRLRVEAGHPSLLERVISVMVPPCEAGRPDSRADWTLRLDEAEPPVRDDTDALFADRPVLALPYDGPQLAVLDAGDGRLRALGRYRSNTAASIIETDADCAETRVLLPDGDELGGRWADWLAKVYFASRMQASGWRMLHASAVVINGSAVLFLAGRRGGKSTLAYRARTELGAVFLADDLVLIGPDRTVVGWPTRVALPEELFTGMPAEESERRRITFSPSDYRSSITCSWPVLLGAVVTIVPVTNGGAPSAVVADPRKAAEVATNIPAQRLHTSDLLGLMGGPRTVRFSSQGELFGDVPVVELRVGDMKSLPKAPVWEALSSRLPLVRVS